MCLPCIIFHECADFCCFAMRLSGYCKIGYHMKVQIFGVLLRNLAITFIENGIYSSGGNRTSIFTKEVKITLLNNYIQWRSTFFLMIADFGCVRLSTHCRIWLLFAIEA